ncbi:uncharacterized protein B0P05DRAFT_535334 [Gilbertella persicaria]|uniref:uncharacterized protein n=1 Tax=Gilbertella persicaria TaxID=101096 RepID=UPI0022203D8E|nr:uncharacterized protein B0P05DRAFT_535334 [Gilbertella persicaria]KAI8084373.1 hypothetical protein B0P05DRAFT_535334 [Gilbertella persicaria]
MNDDLASFQNTNFFTPTRSLPFTVEEDPWSTTGFDPVDEIRQPLSQPTAMDEEVVTEGITAANVLLGVDLPEVFDTAYIRAGPIGDRVSVESLETIISLGGMGPRLFEQISSMIVPAGAMYVTRNEFNTALALVGCAQKNMDLSLLTIYQHRNDLPIPSLSNLNNVSIKRTNPLLVSNTKPKAYDDDPWRLSTSPPTDNVFPVYPDKVKKSSNRETTSENDNSTKTITPVPSRLVEAIADKAFTQALVKSSTESYQWFTDLDQITVTVAEKEGFLFTHLNYWVQSSQRQTSVRRRYSDFYWFWETLLKRYPFRIIPDLPPKKLSGKDKVFLEKRCQGLQRFMNSIVRHPVLKNDEQVIIFLTEQTEFSAWRRAQSPHTEEEFIRANPQTEDLEVFIPKDLDSRIEQIQKRLPKSIEKYDMLCSIMERTIRLNEARALEMKKYNDTLKQLGDIEHDCFVTNCQACIQVVKGYGHVGNYLDQGSHIIETETSSSIAGVLENLKRHRDVSISFLDMLNRKSRLDANQINALARKITANTAKVNQNRGVPGLEAEVERLDALIKSDTEKMIHQQRKDTYIRYCVASELSYLHKQQAFVSLLYQNFVHEQLQYARKTVDNWKALEALLCQMPPKPEHFV